MVRLFRSLSVLVVPFLLAAGAGRATAQTVCEAPLPVVSYYQPPAVSYYQPPVVSYYQPPVVSYYQPPVVSYYQPPVVSYYQAPAVSYYAAPVNTVTTYRYGILPWRRVTVTTYGP